MEKYTLKNKSIIDRNDYLRKFNPHYCGEPVTWFTSDLHLNDTRMFTCPPTTVHYRPQFNSLEEMNHAIINNINHFVDEKDNLFILGDIFCEDLVDGVECFKQIKCKNIVLIVGNHDLTSETHELKKLINDLLNQKNIDLATSRFIKSNSIDNESDVYYMCHYPMKAKHLIEKNKHETDNIYALVGHVHGAWRIQPRMINVGIDAWGFRPVSLYEINFVVNAMKKGYLDQEVYPYVENYKNILNIE